jgi:serine/threonine protein kinase/DNA-binding SARP family transcriptional activator
MEFRILGPIEVLDEERALALGGPKQRAVLAHLILQANRIVPADLLIDDLWGEGPPETARNTLQTYVYRLRKLLGDGRIEGRSGGYVLSAEPEEIDAARFEALVRRAKAVSRSDPADAAATLADALSLWRGAPLADLAEELSLRGQIARLEELRLSAIERRIAAELAMGRHSTMVSELEALTSRYPLRERLWAHLMLALYQGGRQAEALDAFQRARQTLQDELGADPSAALQHLNQQILRRDPELRGDPAPVPPRSARPSRGDLSPGTEFAGYRIEAVLGRGGMSVVYLAEHLALGRKVALKLLAPQLADDARFRERFVRESRIAAGMEHPNIVPIYEAGEAEGFLFIAMRYVPGTDLGKLIRREVTLDPERALWIVREAAAALDAAHARGLVHRDVKPGNILVVPGEGSDGRDLVYLSDFGLTKRLEGGTSGLTQTGQFLGTVDYVAPEQIEGKPVDARTDVYALACVLFECLTGKVPFDRDTQVAALYAHLGERPPRVSASRPDVPGGIDEVVAKALSKSTDGRFVSCGGFATAARDALGPPASSARPTSPGWPKWQAVVGAVAAALVTGGIVFSVSRGETPATEGAQGSPTPTATPSPSPEPNFATVERQLTFDEERLLSYIPEAAGPHCLPLDRPEPIQGELAGLVCQTEDLEVLYELFPTRDLMDAAFQGNANSQQAPSGECAKDRLAVTRYTIEGEPAGRVLCYIIERSDEPDLLGSGGLPDQAHIEWTDQNSLIYAHAVRNDLGDLALYEWWLSSSGPVPTGSETAAKDRPPAAADRRLRDGSYVVSFVQPDRAGGAYQGYLRDKNGRSLVTFRMHLEKERYELWREDAFLESGNILVQKPNRVVFNPVTGICVETDAGDRRPAAYEWSVSGASLSWALEEGGSCAGPQDVPKRFAWTHVPSGEIAFVDERVGRISLMDAGGFPVEPYTRQGGDSPDWLSDGSRIVFADAGLGLEGFGLYSVGADGTDLTQLTDRAGNELHPAPSPDGSLIAFVFLVINDTDTFRSSIVVADPDGGGWTKLITKQDESLGWPAWSPDGSRIAFVGLTDRWSIYVMDADGTDVTEVREEPGDLSGLPLSWTPDGQRIVFWGHGPDEEALRSMRPDGTGVREFIDGFPTSEFFGHLELSWSPDGQWIVMGGPAEDQGTLAVLARADGSRVFTIGTFISEPSWRPDIG